MTGTWIAIAAGGTVEERPVPERRADEALRTLLGEHPAEAVDIARDLSMIVAVDYDRLRLAANTVANLTAWLLGPGLEHLLRGDAVLAASRDGGGLTGADLERARTAVTMAASLRPHPLAPGQYQQPSAADPRLTVLFGWDRRARSFFVWVGDLSHDPHERPVVWAGAGDPEITTLAQLTARAEGHLMITPMLARLLRYDRAVAEHGGPTLLQRLGGAEREHVERCGGEG